MLHVPIHIYVYIRRSPLPFQGHTAFLRLPLLRLQLPRNALQRALNPLLYGHLKACKRAITRFDRPIHPCPVPMRRLCWCGLMIPPTHLLRQPLRQEALARLQILLLSRHGRQGLRLPRRELRLGGRALCAKPWVWYVSKNVMPHFFSGTALHNHTKITYIHTIINMGLTASRSARSSAVRRALHSSCSRCTPRRCSARAVSNSRRLASSASFSRASAARSYINIDGEKQIQTQHTYA